MGWGWGGGGGWAGWRGGRGGLGEGAEVGVEGVGGEAKWERAGLALGERAWLVVVVGVSPIRNVLQQTPNHHSRPQI